jgi:GxxExxY protein
VTDQREFLGVFDATCLASSVGMLVDDGTGGISGEVIGIAIAIHRKYGPGLLEQAYSRPLALDLRAAGHRVECQPRLQLVHAGITIDNAYRPDMIVDGRLVIEVKVVTALLPVHKQQLKTYLKLSEIAVGLLINFNVPILRHGIRRVLLTDL